MKRTSLRSWQRQWNREAQSNSEQKSNKKHQLWLNILTSNQPFFSNNRKKDRTFTNDSKLTSLNQWATSKELNHMPSFMQVVMSHVHITTRPNKVTWFTSSGGHLLHWSKSPKPKKNRCQNTLPFKELQSLLEKHERQTYVNRNIATYASKRYPAIHCNL